MIGSRRGAGVLIAMLAIPVVLSAWAWSRGGARRLVAGPLEPPGPSASAVDLVRFGHGELRRYRLGPAAEAFARAKRLDPTLAPARLGLIWVHALRMHRREALAEFEELARLRPLDFDQALLWTQIRCYSWDPDRVIAPLRAVLAVDPDDRDVRLTLAEGLQRSGDTSEALEVLEVLPPSDPEARALRARIAIDRSDLVTAGTLLAEGPADQPELAVLRGQLALRQRDARGAVAWFRKALKDRPDDRSCCNGLSQALRLSGEAQEADSVLAIVRRHDTLINLVLRAAEMTWRDDAELHRRLGAACEALDFLPEARAWYGLALARDPLDSRTQVAFRRLSHAVPPRRP